MEEEKNTLYIPMGVKTENELFPGFGKRQLLQATLSSAGFLLVGLFLWAVTKNVTMAVILILAGIIGSVMMTTKDQSNLSVVDQVMNMIRFAKSQKYYPYRYMNEWRMK